MGNYQDFIQFLSKNKKYENGIKVITTEGELLYEAIEEENKGIEFHTQAMLVIAKKLGLEIKYDYNSFNMAEELAMQNLIVFYLNDETCLLFLPDSIPETQYTKLVQITSSMENYVFYIDALDKIIESKWNKKELLKFLKMNQETKKMIKRRTDVK